MQPYKVKTIRVAQKQSPVDLLPLVAKPISHLGFESVPDLGAHVALKLSRVFFRGFLSKIRGIGLPRLFGCFCFEYFGVFRVLKVIVSN